MFTITKKKFLAGSLLAVALVTSGCAQDQSKEESTPAEQSAAIEQQRNIVVYGDTINSHLIEEAICVVNSRFEQGQRLVFRASVNDTDTKEMIEDAKVKVMLATGEEFDMVLGPHGAEATPLYSVAWTIPEDFPTGTLDYEYVAEVDGEEYTYEPFDVSLSKLTIIDPAVAAPEPEAPPEAKS